MSDVVHNVDAIVSGPALQYVALAGNIQFPINTTQGYTRLKGNVLQPAFDYTQLLGTIKTSALNFVNLSGIVQSSSREYIKLTGDINNDKVPSHDVDAVIALSSLGYVQLVGTISGVIQKGPCGSYPDVSYVNLEGWVVNPSPDSVQMPGQGFTVADDFLSSQTALAAYKPTSVFKIFGSTLPTSGISLIITAFTCGVVSFQTRTRTWLRRVDAAPNGILLTTEVNTHTLPNGAVITTTTERRQQQDTLVTIITIQNSSTPNRVSTIVTEKTAGGQTVTRETDTHIINGIINSVEKRTVTTSPPTKDNVQPLNVRTLDGVIHYQWFGQVNPEWAGGEQEGTTSIQKSQQTVPGILNGKTVDSFGNPIYNQTTDTIETDPTGKVIETHVEEIGTRRDIGTVTTDTTENFNGIVKTTVRKTTYPDGSSEVSTTVSNALTGDQTSTTIETVTDEYGQVTTTQTVEETKTFPDPTTGIIRQQTTKTVTVTRGGVSTVDTTVVTNNDFEDDIISKKIKVYFIQEFTLTCVIDEFSMMGLAEINITHQKQYSLLELFGQQLGNANLSYALRQKLMDQFNEANSCIAPFTLQALGRQYRVVFAQSASGFRAKLIPGTEPHVYELQLILQSRSDLVSGTFGF